MIQMAVALLRNIDGEWVEPKGAGYYRQIIKFKSDGDKAMANVLFRCKCHPEERTQWEFTHVGVMPMAGIGDPTIINIGKRCILKNKQTFTCTVTVPTEATRIVEPHYEDPALQALIAGDNLR